MRDRATIAWILTGVITALLVGEIGIRIFGAAMPDPSPWPSVETDLKSEQLDGLVSGPDLVLLGSSVTEAAVDPVLLSGLSGHSVSYNSALPFSSPLATEVWLDEVMDDVHPDLLIIGVPIWPAHGEDPGLLGAGISGATSSQPLVEVFDWSALVSKRGVLADWDRLETRQNLKSSGLWTDAGHQTGYYEKIGGTIAGRFPPYGKPEMSAEQAEGVERMIDTARDRGSDVVLLLEPGRYPGEVSEADIATYVIWLEERASRWGVELWDTYSLDWDESLFADEAHFNRAGTEAFTRHLAGLLADHRSASE